MSSIDRNKGSGALRRSYLYVPGHNATMLDKALQSDADVVVVDLEDAVPSDRKDVARANALAALSAGSPKPLHVRIAGAGDPRGLQDLRALAHSGVELVRLAKVSRVDDVRRAAQLLHECQAPAAVRFGCLLESALGVEHAFAIASADPRVAAISLGEADLSADLGVLDASGLQYARSRVVVAARAAGLAPPIQSVYTDVKDLAGLRASSAEGRAMGFRGRSVIHPSQIPIVNEAHGPTAAERAQAHALLDAADRVGRDGAFLLEDGRLADPATVAQAHAHLGDEA